MDDKKRIQEVLKTIILLLREPYPMAGERDTIFRLAQFGFYGSDDKEMKDIIGATKKINCPICNRPLNKEVKDELPIMRGGN